MSRNELYPSNKFRSQDFTLALGILTAPVPNFYVGFSKIVSLELVTVDGAGAGTAVVSQVIAANAGVFGVHTVSVTVASTVNTDVSKYRLWWVNEIAANATASYVA